MFNLGFFEFSKLLDNESEVAIQIGDKKYLIGKEFGYDDLGRVRVTSYLLGDMEFKSKPEFLKYLDTDTLAIYDEMWTKLKE